jgi:hypothetical protein
MQPVLARPCKGGLSRTCANAPIRSRCVPSVGTNPHGIEQFGAVNNLLGVAPSAATETQFYTNRTYVDTIGRCNRLGARFQI